MTEWLQLGPTGTLIIIIFLMARMLWDVRQRKLRTDEHIAGRDTIDEVREDVKDVRRTIHQIRELMQGLVTKMAVMEYRMDQVEHYIRGKP